MKKNILLVAGFSFLLFSACSSADIKADVFNSDSYTESPEQVNRLLSDTEFSNNLHILDVRTPDEFSISCLKGAENIDYRAGDFTQQIDKLDKSASYLVYCRTGVRSAGAASVMRKAGFTRIIELKGGITAWTQAGQPVETDCK